MHAREPQIKDEAKVSFSIWRVATTLDRRLSISKGCSERTWLEVWFRAVSDVHTISASADPNIDWPTFQKFEKTIN